MLKYDQLRLSFPSYLCFKQQQVKFCYTLINKFCNSFTNLSTSSIYLYLWLSLPLPHALYHSILYYITEINILQKMSERDICDSNLAVFVSESPVGKHEANFIEPHHMWLGSCQIESITSQLNMKQTSLSLTTCDWVAVK